MKLGIITPLLAFVIGCAPTHAYVPPARHVPTETELMWAQHPDAHLVWCQDLNGCVESAANFCGELAEGHQHASKGHFDPVSAYTHNADGSQQYYIVCN